jgi:hypothetical protein
VAAARREAGQAFPIYITVVAGLLFLAFAYFAVGQAAVARNSGQGAADAAALAAVMEARGELRDGLLEGLLAPESREDILDGHLPGASGGCAEAQELAARNGADLHDNDGDGVSCRREAWPEPGFTVEIRTRGTVGDSIVPGTEDQHVEASATAVIEPRCRLSPSSEEEPPSGEEGEEDPEEDEDGGDEKKPRLELRCDGEDLIIDPEDDDFFLDPADLFSVHLAE